jgi:predicted Zn-dependent protease
MERPPVDTDEGGLWALMDREEARLRRSPLIVRDIDMGKHLQDMVCRLSGVHCPDVRVHVVRTPWFNASMAPNGMMQVWTGLLLRMENEAQLAAVLGHELAHYLERHSIERLRDAKSRAGAAQFMALFGLVGALGQLGVMAGMYSFSREHETRADRLGLQLSQKAGWSGHEAPKVWDNLLQEAKILGGDDVGKRSPMFATHPAMDDRQDTLRKHIVGEGDVNSQSYAKLIARHRMGWIQDEIRRAQYDESLVLFNRMVNTRPDDHQALFGRAESRRLRAKEGDQALALTDLEQAARLHSDSAPVVADIFRSLGLIHKDRRQAPQAIDAFERYLKLAPEAADAGLMNHYISELKT